MAERASLPLAEALRSDEGVTRLVQRLALSERFHFFLLVCDTPRVARATFDVLAEEVPIEREEPVRLVRIDPYEAHADLQAPIPFTFLVDQGTSDRFLERELRPELFEVACRAAGQPLTLRRHEGYDHSYYFVSTFMNDHLRHHAKALRT